MNTITVQPLQKKQRNNKKFQLPQRKREVFSGSNESIEKLQHQPSLDTTVSLSTANVPTDFPETNTEQKDEVMKDLRTGDFDPSPTNEQTTSLENPTVTKKEKCPYGVSCYRKNPAHFNEFYHPSNSEVEDEKPECEYGTSCYRKNRDHIQNYKHTIAIGGRGNRSTRRKSKLKDEDSSDVNEYDLEDSFLNDDESSFQSSVDDDDDDTEYNPEDDLSDLISSANSFVHNTK